MAARLTAEELAGVADRPAGLVERLAGLGILRPAADGSYAPGDVALVRLLAAFEDSGIALEDIAQGVASGDIDYSPVALYFPETSPPGETLAALAARLGREPGYLARLLGAFGLPQPGAGDRVREDEAATLERLLHAWELLDDEALVQLARFQGETLRRLAAANIRFFEENVRRRVISMDAGWREGGELVAEMAGRATAYSRELTDWLYVRHFERALVAYIADNTEEYLDEHGIRARPPRRPPAIAFLDLTGFTALTEERGDAAAAELASRLALVVAEAARGHGGQPVKWLGDGVMFHFDEPAAAVRCSLELVRRASEAVDVPARVGVSAGPVVFQDGDYFGRTVNVAARIADYARPGEVLASGEVLAAGELAGVGFERIGEIPLKGVSDPVDLYRALPDEGSGS